MNKWREISEVMVYLSALAFGIGISLYVVANQLGPRWVWASDACPAPNEICGVMPLIIPASVIGTAVWIFVGTTVIKLAFGEIRIENSLT